MSDNEAFLAFSKPFIQATQSVFETMISTNIKPGKPEFKTGHSSLCEITSVIPESARTGLDATSMKHKINWVTNYLQKSAIINIPHINPHQRVGLPITLSWDTPGIRYGTLKVDATNTNDESIEGNNEMPLMVSVLAPWPTTD